MSPSRVAPVPQSAPERRCPARAKKHGGQCRHLAGMGTPHHGVAGALCKYHGGLSPGGLKHAERLAAAAAAQSFGLPIEMTPDEALEAELWRTAGIVSWLGSHLQSVSPEQRLAGEMAPFAHLYGEERRHLTAVAKSCVDAGLDQRRVSALEKAATAFADVLRRILDDLGVLDHPDAPRVVRQHLALLGPGGTDG